MSYEKLLSLVGDNEEAKGIIANLKSTANDNVNKIGTLETQVQEIGKTRDQYKAGNALVKEKFGIDKINDETLSDVISKKGGDEKLLNEINDLKAKFADSNNLMKEMESNHSKQLVAKDLKNAYLNSGLTSMFKDTLDDDGKTYAENYVLQGATIENGAVVYKNEDGTTMYNSNNQPLTIQDRKQSFVENDTYSGYWKTDMLPGGGKEPNSNSSGGVSFKRSTMSASEKGQYISENGQEAFLSLPN